MKPPDVQQLIVDHLGSAVGALVVKSRPDDGTGTYVRVLRTGGAGRSNRIRQTVQVTLDSYARTTDGAKLLAENVDEWVHALPESALPISTVAGASTPSELPDPNVKSARYTATYQLVVKLR